MKNKFKLLCLLLTLNFGFVTPTFSDDVKIQRVLNTGKVNECIAQDKDGLLWIGTEGGGLLCYDGTNVKKVKICKDEKSYEVIPFVFIDSEGIIWAFIQDRGLFSYDKNTGLWRSYTSEIGNSNSLTTNNIDWPATLIAEDKEGIIWIGTSGGLNCYDKKTDKLIQHKHVPGASNTLSNNTIRAIFVDREGIVWIGTEDGLNKYNKNTRGFHHYKHEPNKSSLGDNFVYTIAEDKAGNLWIGTKNAGINKFDKKNGTFTNYRNDPKNSNSLSCDEVRHIMIDRFDNLWICTQKGTGIDKYNSKTNSFEHYKYSLKNTNSISSNQVLYSFEDNSGIVWLVDASGGINKCTSGKNVFKNYSYDPDDSFSVSSDNLASLHEDRQKNIWVGTFKSGLCLYSNGDKFEKFYHDSSNSLSLPGDTVYSVIDACDNKLWVGIMGDFISLFDINTKSVLKTFKNPYSMDTPCNLVVDNKKADIIWFASFAMSGLFNLNTTTGEFFQYKHDPTDISSVSNENTFDILQDGDVLWIGTGGGGLTKFNKTTGKCVHYRHDPNDKTTISGNVVLQSFIDSRGNFWVTTDDGGLNKFNKQTGKFTRYGTECGFPSNSTRHILEDKEKYLWISTDSGIVKFDPLKSKVAKWFSTADGLPSNDFEDMCNAIKDSQGNFWFSTVKGLCKFNPKEANKIEPNKHIPPIVLSSFKSKEGTCNENGIKKLTEVNLQWPDNSFCFTFAALDYMGPEKNQYAYKLEGFDKDWNYIGTNNFGQYSNLHPGEYTLRLKGSNNDGIWNEKGLYIKITITPPFWMTSCCKVLMGLVVLSILGILVHLRVRALRNKAIHMRDHAVSNVAKQVVHDISSPLMALSGVLNNLPELSEQKRGIIRNSTQRINDIVNNLMVKYDVNKKNGAGAHLKAELISSLLDHLVSEKRYQMLGKSIKMTLELDNNTHSCFAILEPGKLKRTLSNLINNAAEAIESNGIIRIILTRHDNNLVIKIIDNGKGIPEDILLKIKQEKKVSTKKEGQGIGVSSAVESIKSWNGSYDIQSKVGEGTTFTITLPITEEPDWFQGAINISPNTHIVVLDDDESIHSVWKERFHNHLENKIVTFEDFYEPLAFSNYCETSRSVRDLFLVDYELLNSNETGWDLIERLDLKQQAILVTSRYEEEEVRERIKELGIKIIPKNFALYISIFVKDSNA